MNSKDLTRLCDEVKLSRTPLRGKKGKVYEWETDFGSKLVAGCYKGAYVLVIGNEAILRKDISNGDSCQLVLDQGKELEIFNDSVTSFDDLKDSTSLNSKICEVIETKHNEWKTHALEYLDPSLRLLLESKCFRLIITTAFDPILEYALNQIWDEDVVVKNINDDDSDKIDIRLDENGKSEFYDIKPTLYYAFGKAYINEPGLIFGVKDDEKILTVDRWLGRQKPQGVLEYIKNKQILAVGCKFDDWFFRFFWYILSQKPDTDSTSSTLSYNIKKNGSVAVSLTEPGEDRMKKYIIESEIKYFDDSRNFMNYLGPDLVKHFPPTKGEIFISYASEDRRFAQDLYTRLCEKNQNVWFDIRLIPGDRYEERITAAINQCNIFMPILSGQTIKDILNPPDEERYYMKEWKMAQQKALKDPKFCVIPIVVPPYESKNNNYHKEENIPDCIYKSSAYFSTENYIVVEELLNYIEEQRKRYK